MLAAAAWHRASSTTVLRLSFALAVVVAGCAAPGRPSVASAVRPAGLEVRTATHDLYCPARGSSAPYVLLALDEGQRRADAVALSRTLAAAGYGVVVSDLADPGALQGLVRSLVPPPGCAAASAWAGMGIGSGAPRVLRALQGARSFVLVDATGAGSIEHSPCSARTEAAGCALCQPRVLLIDSERGPCRGAPSGERMMRSALGGHARARAVLRDAHGCDTEGALLRTCPPPCERSERIKAFAIAWLAGDGTAVAPSPPLQDLASWESRLRNNPPPASVQFNVSTVAGSEYYAPWGWGGALGLRPEFLFLRNSSKSVGVGPYGELALGDGRPVAGSGLSLLVPVRGRLSIVPSVGVYGRSRAQGWQAGAVGGLFVGNRTYNEHTHAEFAIGLRADARAALDGSRQMAYSLQLQFDLFNLGWLGFL